MASGVDCGKEATILGNAHELVKGLLDLRAKLDNSFNRTPQAEKEGECQPQQASILDEIMDVQRSARGILYGITDMVDVVLRKIH